MKYFALGLAVVLALPSLGFAKEIGFWSYEELFEKSELVAIVELKSITDSDAKFTGNGKSDDYDGKIAHLTVGKVLKGEAELDTIKLLYFVYSKKVRAVVNGPVFISFSDAEKYQYLVFLKKSDQGTFIPVRGQYDARFSLMRIEKIPFTLIKPFKRK